MPPVLAESKPLGSPLVKDTRLAHQAGGKAAAGYAVLGGKAAADYAVLGGRLAAKYAKQRGQTMSMDDADSQKADRSDLKSEDLVPVKLNHPALQLVRERAEQGSKPGQRTDAYKLGLVIEGGGMRGAVSGGALQALHDLGLKDAFDAVYGSSAGAINATYFLSDQRTGVDIYTEDIANQQFIDLGRLLNRNGDQGPVLNLKFLLDYVMEEVKPLDWEAVLRSPIPLKVVASSLDTLEPVMLDNFESKEDLRLCLKASANIPEIAGAPLVHRGQRLVDAAVFEAVPFRVAIADGCTHVITLCTRPPFKGGRLHKAFSDVITAAVKRAVLSPDYMKAAWQRELDMLAADGLSTDEMLLMSLDEGSEKLPFFAGTHVYPIFPGDAARYAPVCTDVETLKAGVAEGGKAVMRVFRPSEEQVQASERAVENPGSAAVALNEVKDHESDLRLSP
ncbi:hypothetical protein WJX72_006985 [[Myrmecia] bisecta]|uniref:Patatin n=1 Tax=[Myrmecia] bisecta TaxID=41462 RepID=A0AAW1PB09_9CHLO